jgi:hypothetical protein
MTREMQDIAKPNDAMAFRGQARSDDILIPYVYLPFSETSTDRAEIQRYGSYRGRKEHRTQSCPFCLAFEANLHPLFGSLSITFSKKWNCRSPLIRVMGSHRARRRWRTTASKSHPTSQIASPSQMGGISSW